MARIVSWSAGAGATPPIGYLSETGITQDISQAVNLKGARGADGQQGEQGEQGPRGAEGEQGPQGAEGEQGQRGQTGSPGLNGWTPILTVESDGNRRVLRVMSWVGGEGTAPNTGYIGSAGIVATASEASNFAIEGSGGATSNFTPSEESELQGIARNVSITGEDILTTTTSALYLSADDLSTFPDPTELRDIPHTIITEGTYFIYIATRSAMDPDIKFTVSRNNAPIYEFTYRHDFSISNTDNGYAVLGHAADSFRRLNLRTGDVISAQTINTNTIARFMNTSAENITDIVEIYRRAETTSESQLIDISGGLVQSGRITSLPTGWSRRREDASGQSGSLHRAIGVAFKYFSTPTWSRGVRISEIITKEQSDAITANTLKLGVTDGNVAPLAERFDRTLTLASTSLSSGTARAIIGSTQLNNPGSDYIISVLLEGASYTVDIAFGSDPIIDVSTDPGSILTLYLLGSSEFSAQNVAGSVAVDKVALAAGWIPSQYCWKFSI